MENKTTPQLKAKKTEPFISIKQFLILGLVLSLAVNFVFLRRNNIQNIPKIEPMTEAKADFIKDCNGIKDHFDRIKINTFSRCLSVCNKVSNSQTTNNKVRAQNSDACKTGCEKAKVDMYEDIFYVERKTDDRYHCRFNYSY